MLPDIKQGTIYRISLTDGEIKSLDIANIGKPLGVAYYEEEETMYWSDANVGIKAATLSGQNERVILTVGKVYDRRCVIERVFTK